MHSTTKLRSFNNSPLLEIVSRQAIMKLLIGANDEEKPQKLPDPIHSRHPTHTPLSCHHATSREEKVDQTKGVSRSKVVRKKPHRPTPRCHCLPAFMHAEQPKRSRRKESNILPPYLSNNFSHHRSISSSSLKLIPPCPAECQYCV
jgi:hypothetical protein